MSSNRVVTGNCAICNAEIHGKEFKYAEFYIFQKTEPSSFAEWTLAFNEYLIGIRCPECNSCYCHPAHKKQLKFKAFKGYSKGSCPECDNPLDVIDRIFHLNVSTPRELLMQGEREAPKPIGLKGKLNLAMTKSSLIQGDWKDNENLKVQLIKDVEDVQEVLMQEIITSARFVDPKRTDYRAAQVEALELLGALGQLGAAWAFREDTLDDPLIEDIIAATKYEKKQMLQSSGLDLKVAATIVLIELEKQRRKGDFVPHILSACDELDLAKSLFKDVINGLGALAQIREVSDLLLEIAQGTMFWSEPDSLWHVKLFPAPAWYASRQLLLSGDKKTLDELVPLRLSELENDMAWSNKMHWLHTLLLDNVPEDCVPIDQLLDALVHPEARIRAMSASLLKGINDTKVISGLTKALKDNVDYVVQSAVRALGEIDEIQAKEAIQTVREHPNRKVRKEAKKALKYS